MHLVGKTIVVTGAGSGIGRELTVQLINLGSQVAALDYDADRLSALEVHIAASANRLRTYCVDVTDLDQVSMFSDQVVTDFGRVDGVINNAGIIHEMATLEELTRAQVERVFSVNWWGTYNMTQSLLPGLRAQPHAFICNLSSMGGYMPFPRQVAYGASKAAVKLFTEGLRQELARDSHISVSLVYPGAVTTSIVENAPDMSSAYKEWVREQVSDEQPGMSAAAAAAVILRGIQKDKARIIVGTDSWFIDKLYRLAPVTTAALMSWVMSRLGPQPPREAGAA